jgi:hypothetical protein
VRCWCYLLAVVIPTWLDDEGMQMYCGLESCFLRRDQAEAIVQFSSTGLRVENRVRLRRKSSQQDRPW